MSKLLAMIMSKKPQYMNLSVVGNPTISSGVVSDFSASDYCEFSSSYFSQTINYFEVSIKFNTGDMSEITTNMGICGRNNSRCGFYIRSDKQLCFSTVNFSTNTRRTYIGEVLQNNTTYWAKWIYSQNGIYGYFSTDGINWTEYNIGSGTNSADLSSNYIFGNSYSTSFTGSIDLYNSYIKINNTKYKFQFTMPLTKVGSPTIVDGVVSGFSSSDYLTMPKIPFNNLISWEIKIAFQVNSDTNTHQEILENSSSSNGIQIYYNYSNSRVYCIISESNGTLFNKYFSVAFNTKYYLRIKFIETAYIYEYSTDNINWINFGELSSTTKVSETTNLTSFGYSLRYSGRALNGLIDFNNSYIVLNGTKYIFTLP